MKVEKRIRDLRIVALLLFFLPFLGLIGSLLFHNALVSISPFANKGKIFPFESYEIGNKIEVICSSENNWCNFNTINKLDQCNDYEVIGEVFDFANQKLSDEKEIIQLFKKKKIKKVKVEIIDRKATNCILNSNFYYLYKIFPEIFEKIIEKSYKFNLGTSKIVNPMLYGETSISNIVKRFPVKYIFKPLMFISSIIMFIYWFYNNRIFNHLFNEDKIKLFYIFGILSAIFLFLHVFFLGDVYESKILNQIRRTYVVFFILFEILAQVFLLKNILNKKKHLETYLNNKIVICKFYFVLSICISTLIIFLILLFKNLDPKIDYILEWNYFLILIIFYYLSFLMWKKKIN